MFEVLFNLTLVSSSLKLLGLASIATNLAQIFAIGIASEPIWAPTINTDDWLSINCEI